ncbi:MAG: superoxide dismutase family protein [Sporichthyaceae bacterium]
MNRALTTAAVLSLVVTLAACGSDDEVELSAAAEPEVGASATLVDVEGTTVGTITFADVDGRTLVSIELVGAESVTGGYHGFHIHANDLPDAGEGCIADADEPSATWFASVDGHWTKGADEEHGMHAGDMPAVFALQDGTATGTFMSDAFTVEEVKGRGVILHAGPDNYGNIPVGEGEDQYTANSALATEKTAKTGNSGDRVACGVIA